MIDINKTATVFSNNLFDLNKIFKHYYSTIKSIGEIVDKIVFKLIKLVKVRLERFII